MLRALVVSYNFPPVGGAGVARMLKLVKYLPEHDVRPAVLTVSNPSVPVLDASLEREVSPAVERVRVRTLEPGYGLKRAAWSASAGSPSDGATSGGRAKGGPGPLGKLVALGKQLLVPDPQVLWQPAAQRALAARLWRGGDDAVLISGPPFSQFLLAPLVRARRGVGLVLDYRDEWSTYRTTYEMMGSLSARVGDWLEPRLLARAHAITMATAEFREALLARHAFLDPSRVHAIPNGYDPDDFPEALPEPPTDRFVVSYAGTLFKLTSPRGFVGALRRLHAAEPVLAQKLEVRIMGRIVETEQHLFADAAALGLRLEGYVDHEKVLGELAASHLVLCILDEVAGVERIYPGKIFELMVLGRPCLILAPDGALAKLARRHGLGEVIAPRDEAAIAQALERALRAFVAGTYRPSAQAQGIERYHRRALAGEFAAVLQEAVRRARVTSSK